jgi:hypothetical protein
MLSSVDWSTQDSSFAQYSSDEKKEIQQVLEQVEFEASQYKIRNLKDFEFCLLLIADCVRKLQLHCPFLNTYQIKIITTYIVRCVCEQSHHYKGSYYMDQGMDVFCDYVLMAHQKQLPINIKS